ncbi:hypothetical protein N799_04620 [Lysobacter arseniciresistens ZS79]|uniref:Anti-sigma factor n=1 Tax=Lysobacter arseniciresistens ZS79 TaxID=913325 RepID=A0A0A0F4V2_9GAMM|nr:hypothetical protein [Lysobacter arseniciresistens]KGM56387.1 hypothetical protein N799_04620 [Lysobacter arseniciresistens ZS79]
MNHQPPNSDELHAFADGQLDGRRHDEVAAWLATHPAEAARVRGWKRDAGALRATLGTAATLPPAPQLQPAAIRRRLRGQRRQRLAQAAVLVLALGLGGSGGWLLRDARPDGPPPMADAVSAYRMIVGREVEMDFASDRVGGLQAWLARHFGDAGRLPDLAAQGYALRGARMLSTPEGPAAMLLYEDAGGATVGVYLRPRTARMRDGARRDGELVARYWAEGDTAVAVVGTHLDQRARKVAPLLRGEI